MTDVKTFINQQPDGVRLILRIFPNAKKNQMAGLWHDEAIKIMLAAPPVDGKANKALIDFLADFFHTKKSRIDILSGQTAHNKVVFIQTDSDKQRADFIDLLTTKIATEAK